MSRRLVAVGVGVVTFCLTAGARADTHTFYFHHSASPVTVPGGTTNFFLDETAPTAAIPTPEHVGAVSGEVPAGETASFPAFISQAFVTETLLGSIIDATVHLSANHQKSCTAIIVSAERVDSAGARTPMATGTLPNQTIPQSSGGGTQGFAAFTVGLDVTGERLILPGEGIAVTVSVMNNCNINLGYNLVYDGVGAQTRISFVSLDVGVAKCLDAVDKAFSKYVKTRLTSLEKCEDAINKGSLSPQNCATEPKTGLKIAKAVAKTVKGIVKRCTGNFVIDNPPSGLGVAGCPGLTGQCNFTFTQLDDGTRGNANDYVDCLLCLADRATDQMNGIEYATTATPPLTKDVNDCQKTVGKVSAKFEDKKLVGLQKCRQAQIKQRLTGACPDPKTQLKISGAGSAVVSGVEAHCSDAVVTGAPPGGLGLSSCAGPPVSCQGTIAGQADLSSCLTCTHEFFVDCLFPATLGHSGPGCP